MLVVTGNGPAAKLSEGLAAEARSSGAEEHDGAGTFGERLVSVARRSDVIAPFGNAQQGQGLLGMRRSQ